MANAASTNKEPAKYFRPGVGFPSRTSLTGKDKGMAFLLSSIVRF
jgi:hypothetical protein